MERLIFVLCELRARRRSAFCFWRSLGLSQCFSPIDRVVHVSMVVVFLLGTYVFVETSLIEVALWLSIVLWDCLLDMERSLTSHGRVKTHEMSSIALELTALALNLVSVATMEGRIVLLKLASENQALQVFSWGIVSRLLLNLIKS